MHKTRLMVVALAMALLAVGCGGSAGKSGEFKGTKKIGLTTALTGQSASYGNSISKAVQLGQDDINKKGGVNGYKIEVVIRDDETAPDKAAENTRQLILQDKVVAMLSTVTSAQCQAAMPIAHQYKIVYVAFICNDYRNTVSPEFLIPEYVSIVPNTFMEGTAAGIDAGRRKNLKKWYILSPDYSFGKSETPAFVRSLKRTNPDVQILNPESQWYVPLNTFNFQTVIPKIQAAKPDAIYSNIFAATQTAFINGALQADPTFFKKYQFMTLSSVDDFNALPDKYPVGIRIYERAPFFAIEGDKVKTFANDYKARFGSYPSDWAVMAYDAINVWATAAERARSFDTDKVLAALVGQSFDTLRGKITIRKEDHQADVTIWVGTTTRDPAYPFVVLKDVFNPAGKELLIPLDKVSAMQNGKCPDNDIHKCP